MTFFGACADSAESFSFLCVDVREISEMLEILPGPEECGVNVSHFARFCYRLLADFVGAVFFGWANELLFILPGLLANKLK